MRAAFLLLALLLCRASAAAAQTSLAAAPMDPRLTPARVENAVASAAALRRDHLAGALQGAALGAVVGGLGFAALTYLGNRGDAEGEGYALLAIPVGAVVGGAVGLVAGAIVGAPERDEGRRAQVLVPRDTARGVTAAISLPLRPRPR
jgi:peptidoglycan/LPS O-acetylase OafA/YrhL